MIALSIDKKTKAAFVIVTFVAFLALAVSVYFYVNNMNGSQKTFVFPSVESGRFIIERRNISESYMDSVECYVNEILLGPQTERTERLFPKNVVLLNCFQRNKVLYVDLSKEVLDSDGKTLSIKDSIDLLKKTYWIISIRFQGWRFTLTGIWRSPKTR